MKEELFETIFEAGRLRESKEGVIAIFDMLADMKYEYADADFDTDTNGVDVFTRLRLWMEEIKGQKYLNVSGRRLKDGSWNLRCWKSKNNKGTFEVKEKVPELTTQTLDAIIDKWFEDNSNNATEEETALDYDDWDSPYSDDPLGGLF